MREEVEVLGIDILVDVGLATGRLDALGLLLGQRGNVAVHGVVDDSDTGSHGCGVIDELLCVESQGDAGYAGNGRTKEVNSSWGTLQVFIAGLRVDPGCRASGSKADSKHLCICPSSRSSTPLPR